LESIVKIEAHPLASFGAVRRLCGAAAVLAGLLLAACGGGGGGTVDDDIVVTLTSQGGATTVAAGGQLGLRANVENSRTMGVTWSLTGASCPSQCGTLTVGTDPLSATYHAPAGVTTPFTVTVTATSTEDTTRSGRMDLSVQARICAPNAALLDGHYAFLLQGFEQNARAGAAVVGSISTDACGQVTGGTLDYHLGPTFTGSLGPISGSYTIGSDRRGTLSIGFGAVTRTFAIALGGVTAGVATEGAINETDVGSAPSTMMSGSVWRQDPSAFAASAVSGRYAFVLNGWNGAGPREAVGGTVTADGAGAFSGGLLDRKVFGFAPVTDTAWTGSLGTPTADGRMTLGAPALTGSGGHAVLYVVDATHLLALVSDPGGAGRVLGGRMVAQQGAFDAASLNGTLVTYQTANYEQSCCTQFTTSTLALIDADGAGTLHVNTVDQNFAGNVVYNPNPGLVYQYTVAPNGHATIMSGNVDGGRWYLTGPNAALMLGFDPGGSIGAIEAQSGGPFAATSLTGTYVARQAPGGAFGSVASSGIGVADGLGGLTTILDNRVDAGLVVVQTAPSPLTVAPNGRATDVFGNAIYLISPSRFVLLNKDPSATSSTVLVFQR
jgi:hypothetical protein